MGKRISQAEKQIRDEALALGGRLIILRAEGMRERFKPSGEEFEFCRQGRMLLLAPWPENTDTGMTRSTALNLNFMASQIAALTTESLALAEK